MILNKKVRFKKIKNKINNFNQFLAFTIMIYCFLREQELQTQKLHKYKKIDSNIMDMNLNKFRSRRIDNQALPPQIPITLKLQCLN